MSATKKMWASRAEKFNPLNWFKPSKSSNGLRNEGRNVATGLLAFFVIISQFAYLMNTDSLLWYNSGDSLATKEFVTKVIRMDETQCTAKGIEDRKGFSQRTNTPILNRHVVRIYRDCESSNAARVTTQKQLENL